MSTCRHVKARGLECFEEVIYNGVRYCEAIEEYTCMMLFLSSWRMAGMPGPALASAAPITFGPILGSIASLLGAIFGVLGSLFFLYERFGQKNGVLRWIVRLGIPLFLAMMIFVPELMLDTVALAGFRFQDVLSRSPAELNTTLPGFTTVIGAAQTLFLVGLLSTVFANTEEVTRRFSWRDALLGVGLALIVKAARLFLVGTTLYAEILANNVDQTHLADAIDLLIVFPLVFILAGVLRFLYARAAKRDQATRLFSGRGTLISLLLAATLIIPSYLAVVIVFGLARAGTGFGLTLNSGQLHIVTSLGLLMLVNIPITFILAELSRAIFEWEERMGREEMEQIGILMLLAGFGTQVVVPLATLTQAIFR